MFPVSDMYPVRRYQVCKMLTDLNKNSFTVDSAAANLQQDTDHMFYRTQNRVKCKYKKYFYNNNAASLQIFSNKVKK